MAKRVKVEWLFQYNPLNQKMNMETRICNTSAPAMPALWPVTGHGTTDSDKRPNHEDRPKTVSWYLQPLTDIASRPDRAEILRRYFSENSETIV